LAGGINLFAYTANNPINLIDPDGRLAFVIPIAVCASGGCQALAGAIAGVGLGIGIATLWDAYNDSDVDEQTQADWLRENDYQRYKNRCGQKPPPGLSKCDELRWKLQQAKDCRDLRQRWDDRWQPGRHEQAINDWNNRVNRLNRIIAQECCNE
jgi:type VI secretion system secreted protein VgrG